METNDKQNDIARRLVALPSPGPGMPAGDYYAFGPYVLAVVSALGTRFHGQWTAETEAARFAASLHDGGAHVEAVAPYYYAPAWGAVPAETTHAEVV